MAIGLCVASVLASSAPGAEETGTLPPASSTRVDFARDVRPILAKNCLSCHGPSKQQGGLRLDEKARACAGGDSGPAFEPGKSGESLLIEYVAGLDPDTVMPPKGDRLTPAEVGLLRAWIDQGASWPDGATLAPASAAKPGGDHWAFRAPSRPELAGRPRPGLGPQPDRRLRAGQARGERGRAVARGRPRHPDPPAEPRPARPAADARRGRGVPRATLGPTPTSSWSTACSPRRTTASAGAGTGSTWPATPTATATRRTRPARTPGATATG